MASCLKQNVQKFVEIWMCGLSRLLQYYSTSCCRSQWPNQWEMVRFLNHWHLGKLLTSFDETWNLVNYPWRLPHAKFDFDPMTRVVCTNTQFFTVRFQISWQLVKPWLRYSSFDCIPVLTFCKFCLKMTAPFGVCPPKWEAYQQNPKMAHPCTERRHVSYRLPKSVHHCDLCTWWWDQKDE